MTVRAGTGWSGLTITNQFGITFGIRPLLTTDSECSSAAKKVEGLGRKQTRAIFIMWWEEMKESAANNPDYEVSETLGE